MRLQTLTNQGRDCLIMHIYAQMPANQKQLAILPRKLEKSFSPNLQSNACSQNHHIFLSNQFFHVNSYSISSQFSPILSISSNFNSSHFNQISQIIPPTTLVFRQSQITNLIYLRKGLTFQQIHLMSGEERKNRKIPLKESPRRKLKLRNNYAKSLANFRMNRLQKAAKLNSMITRVKKITAGNVPTVSKDLKIFTTG